MCIDYDLTVAVFVYIQLSMRFSFVGRPRWEAVLDRSDVFNEVDEFIAIAIQRYELLEAYLGQSEHDDLIWRWVEAVLRC